MKESSERNASRPAHRATAYMETMVKMPIRMCPARVPRTTVRTSYTTNATTRISMIPVRFRLGSNGVHRAEFGIGFQPPSYRRARVPVLMWLLLRFPHRVLVQHGNQLDRHGGSFRA